MQQNFGLIKEALNQVKSFKIKTGQVHFKYDGNKNSLEKFIKINEYIN